jgi:hypothetical protein
VFPSTLRLTFAGFPGGNEQLDEKQMAAYDHSMQAILTPAALDFIPAPIRQKLKLKAGTVLDFDETAPFLKATTAISLEDMMSCIGVAKGSYEGLSSADYLDVTRGKADA